MGGYAKNCEKPPFYFGSAIRDPSYFVGRKRELATIGHALGNLPRQSQSLLFIGERLIGKSSLLFRIERAIITSYGDRKRILYLNGKELATTTDLYRFLGHHIEPRYFSSSNAHSMTDPVLLRKLLQREYDTSGPLILLFDNIDRFIERIDARSGNEVHLATIGSWVDENLLFVIATSRSLIDRLVADKGLTSPLFRFAGIYTIGPFGEKDAESILAKGRECGLSEHELRAIKTWSQTNGMSNGEKGYHPAKLQFAGKFLWEKCHSQPSPRQTNWCSRYQDLSKIWSREWNRLARPSIYRRRSAKRKLDDLAIALSDTLTQTASFIRLWNPAVLNDKTKLVIGYAVLLLLILLLAHIAYLNLRRLT